MRLDILATAPTGLLVRGTPCSVSIGRLHARYLRFTLRIDDIVCFVSPTHVLVFLYALRIITMPTYLPAVMLDLL